MNTDILHLQGHASLRIPGEQKKEGNYAYFSHPLENRHNSFTDHEVVNVHLLLVDRVS